MLCQNLPDFDCGITRLLGFTGERENAYEGDKRRREQFCGGMEHMYVDNVIKLECGKRCHFIFFAITLSNPVLTDLQNSFTVTLSSKFAIKKSLNILPSLTRVAMYTLPCKTDVLKNGKLHCRPILQKFNDNKQLHNKIICSVNAHILSSN